jgi:hypothetical protein
MSIDHARVIDRILLDSQTEDILLIITDHLEWSGNEDEHEHDHEHMLKLQEKLNAYLSFVESKEIYETYPHLKGRSVVIEVVCKFPLSDRAQNFYNMIYPVIKGAGMKLRYTLFRGDDTFKG